MVFVEITQPLGTVGINATARYTHRHYPIFTNICRMYTCVMQLQSPLRLWMAYYKDMTSTSNTAAYTVEYPVFLGIFFIEDCRHETSNLVIKKNTSWLSTTHPPSNKYGCSAILIAQYNYYDIMITIDTAWLLLMVRACLMLGRLQLSWWYTPHVRDVFTWHFAVRI